MDHTQQLHRAAKARAVPAHPEHTRNPQTDTSTHPPKKPPHTSTQAISEERESEDRGTAEQGATGGATGAAEGGVDLSARGGGGREAEDPAAHPGGTLAPSGPLLAQRTRIPTLRRAPDAHRLSLEPAGSPQQPAHGTGNREAAARDRNRRAARGGSGEARTGWELRGERPWQWRERSDGRELEQEGGAQAKAGGPNPLWARARRQAGRAQRQRCAVIERRRVVPPTWLRSTPAV